MIDTDSDKAPSSHKLRTGRRSEPGRVYLVTIACHRRLPRFAGLYRGRCFVRALMQVSDSAHTLCYVVMPDHVHWLMQLGPDAGLSSTVQKVKSLTARELRERCKSPSPVWQRGFHDKAARREESLKDMTLYIIANPLRARLATSLKEYSLWDAYWL